MTMTMAKTVNTHYDKVYWTFEETKPRHGKMRYYALRATTCFS